ncbi:MAG: 50S ribosome-binding GTPase [Phycisphaerales bacterium]|nr:50S ribosome-binding GTPase [Phycisphaerales bacterium]
MRPPPIDDIILAVSTVWAPTDVGVLRLSGRGCIGLVERLMVSTSDAHSPARRRSPVVVELKMPDGLSVPARLLCFQAPSSYTGQDVVEIHTIGCLPLLRELSERLIGCGARRALPGEFTTRAFLNRKIAGRGVERIAGLIAASDRAAARAAARLQRDSYEPLIGRVRNVLLDTLAAIEAGIDFVDEEDVRFIDGGRVAGALEPLVTELSAFGAGGGGQREAMPHVALAGLPNAGKSTLFNKLCGTERAIVSPQIGTTRDVLSAELHWGGLKFVLQDCAGLGADCDELEVASYRAAERAADRADVVLWLHDIRAEWTHAEREALERIRDGRCLLVLSQSDRISEVSPGVGRVGARDAIEVSAATSAGLSQLRAALIAAIAQRSLEHGDPLSAELASIGAALHRAVDLAGADPALASAELVALEIRTACEQLDRVERGPLVEDILGRIFSTFCIGK